VTEFGANGLLTSDLSPARSDGAPQLRGATQIARVIVGIVLVMRSADSRGVIERNLMLDITGLDWDWNDRGGDFRQSISIDERSIPTLSDPYIDQIWWSCDSHYLALECSEGISGPGL
jgi:hypothetical protein